MSHASFGSEPGLPDRLAAHAILGRGLQLPTGEYLREMTVQALTQIADVCMQLIEASD